MAAHLVLCAVAMCLAGGMLALLCGRSPARAAAVATLALGLAAIPGVGAAWLGLQGQAAVPVHWPWQVPGGALVLQVDALSSVFLLAIFLVAPLCALYGSAYLKAQDRRRALGVHWFFFCALTACLALVVTAAHVLMFLAAWELMSITSFFLVAHDQQKPEVRHAAWLYLLACHLGAAVVFGLLLYAAEVSGSLHFQEFYALGALEPRAAALVFLAALIGFGTKAGLAPLHVWLPEAHPAAPSHVSALMSALMVKTGLYGIVRVLTWLPAPPPWWGLLLAGIGVGGALYAIAMAALQSDVKRCLAYSTIENVGIIGLGLGLGLYASALGQPLMAALGFAGALLHVWNHALFKALLFLGAGSLLHATGTCNLNRLGGLLKAMPVTGVLLIGGSLAAAALPPLNGFFGEWLIYLGLLQAALALPGGGALPPLLLVGLLALTGALALLVFVRLIGIALLGTPRSAAAAAAHDGRGALLVAPALLLLGCLVLGLAPAGALDLLSAPVSLLCRTDVHSLPFPSHYAWPGFGGLLLMMSVVAAALVLLWLRRRRPCAADATWGCGFTRPSARMSYSAMGFAELAQNRVLPSFLRPEGAVQAPQDLFAPGQSLHLTPRDPVLARLFQPLFAFLGERCVRLRWLQQGKPAIYLAYIFLTGAALMLWSLWALGGG
ncbi:proton-conducting transporter transmembrane domain-containing protein [Geoalkalibacter halelectricus]|uniref:Hydrogenase n=1 Tax=Geoalkalibacter halelectricus TaxID=2847045 RepID=A0ABY5ZJR5_9BACT|nr:proton-conducting transporter membrane subunit [Geoalkalibacter halelectricus]MDO3378287.1 hydrogenase [Geoalkalibacter halelectricus]UWZ79293.1 hydrogenase [Geoalkalibacter halelectricus]